MKANDIFTIAKELPKKELALLKVLIQNQLDGFKPTTTKAIITDIEAENFILKNVFKVKLKGKRA